VNTITRTTIACGIALLCVASQAEAQLDLSNFGKDKKANQAVLSPAGSAPSIWDTLNPFGGKTSVLTFDKPASAVQQINATTQRALAQTGDAIAKPFRDLQNVKLWPSNSQGDQDRSFSLVPDWLKPQPEPQQPTTIADWLAQPRPE
jgi:hypothetical protein